MTSGAATEFSRPIALSQAHEHAVEHSLTALPEECTALAERFAVRSIANVSAQLRLAPHAQGFCITGAVVADAIQTCVITGEAVQMQVNAPINVLLWTQEIDGDLDLLEEAYGVDDIEPIDADDYDLGEMAAQYLALAIDPFPRKEGASLDAILPQTKTNPFSVLAQLKDKA